MPAAVAGSHSVGVAMHKCLRSLLIMISIWIAISVTVMAQDAADALVADAYFTDETMPLSVYGYPPGYALSARLDLPSSFTATNAEKAFLWLDVDDIDTTTEAQILINDTKLTDLPQSLLGEGAGHSGYVPVPVDALKPGANVAKFIFTDNLNNTTLGYVVMDMKLLVVRKGSPVSAATVTEPNEKLAVPGFGDVLAVGKRAAPMKLRLVRGPELGWKEHHLRVGNGRGGWSYKKADYQFLHAGVGKYVFPFGIQQMDNGEILLLGAWNDGKDEKPVMSFSKDNGDSWSDWQVIPNAGGRPMMLTSLGGPNLAFVAGNRYFSNDYGRTWADIIPNPNATNGNWFSSEGNGWVDFKDGKPAAWAEIGWNPGPPGTEYTPSIAVAASIRWSYDGGRTWGDTLNSPQWYWEDTYDGKTHKRGCSEGAVVRARNGWLVAALRTDMLAKYIPSGNDNAEGTAVSISKDDGKTWSPLKFIYKAGRMHGHFLRLKNGDLVLVTVMRDDFDGNDLASYRHGSEAVISKDNGLTWNPAGRYILDEWEYEGAAGWTETVCGHTASTLLNDGRIITVYGYYLSNGVAMIRWKP